MATLLDTGLINFFLPVFVFLFIFVVLFALLSKTELLGKKQVAVNFVAAMCIAVVATFAGNLVKLVGFITPWLVFIILMLFIIFAMFKSFGVTDDKEIWSNIGGQTLIYIIVIIVILIGLSAVFESQITPYDSEGGNGTEGSNQNVKGQVITTLTHPRLLGAIFLLLICAFTIMLLVNKIESK